MGLRYRIEILFFLFFSFLSLGARLGRTRTLITLGAGEPFEMWHKAAIAAKAEERDIGQNYQGPASTAAYGGPAQKEDAVETDIQKEDKVPKSDPATTQNEGKLETTSRRKRFWGRIKKGMKRSGKEKQSNDDAGMQGQKV